MKCLAGMAGLAAGFASGVFGAQGFSSLQAVAGGWLAAVGAVLVEALFELCDASFEAGDEFADRVDTSCIQSCLDHRAQGFSSFSQHNDNAGDWENCLRFIKYLNSYKISRLAFTRYILGEEEPFDCAAVTPNSAGCLNP